MFRRLALPALAVLLWCAARAPSPPQTYELPLELRAENVRDPGPDPDAEGGLTSMERLTPELARIVKMLEQQAIEREWFDEPRPAITVPRDPLFAEWEPD